MASELGSSTPIVNFLDDLSRRGLKGYIIYDVAKQGTEPPHALPISDWNTIVVTSPNTSNFKGWAKQGQAKQIVMNCPEESDLMAMCAWLKHDANTQEQEKYWKMVKKSMDEVGPSLRFIFDEQSSSGQREGIDYVMDDVDNSNAKQYIGVMSDKMWEAENPSYRLVQSVRVLGKSDNDRYLNCPASRVIASKIYVHLSKKMCSREIVNLLEHRGIFFYATFGDIRHSRIYVYGYCA
ncbi:retrotransposon hot spot (RHS) protein, putative [Trypanosoma cruzi marinkellei]|uniref:Retrotransposon hot spot (RHS) protein, putative n=1 Tax=Trypanosoma cruzi marinkellei TaxID=85056 RepID=K2MVU4_TRYCR|nr:retrotransposon hot spot (RHS) protein, putative [Trypanosoma cruzi marinkellei]